VLPARTAHADTLINFDDLADNTAVDSQYVASGVLFNGQVGIPGRGPHISAGDVTAHSGKNVLVNDPIANEFSGGPVVFTFLTPQKTVAFFAGCFLSSNGNIPNPGTLQAFDVNGNLLSTVNQAVACGQTSTPFSVSSTSANIAKVSIGTGSFSYTFIDDLQFGGGAPITLPPGTPMVTITIPTTDTLNFVDQPLRIIGNVSGEGLLPTVKASLQLVTPPPMVGVPGAQGGVIPLAPAGTSQLFDSAFTGSTASFGTLMIGTYQLIVTATNLAAVTGSATVKFTSMPSAVAATASANSFGSFQFAEGAEGGCQVAKFQSGAVAYFPGSGKVIPIPADIASKWFSAQGTGQNYTVLRGGGQLGCPVAPDVSTVVSPLSPGGLLVLDTQDFVRGRIYAPLGGTATYTPKVLVDAITAISTVGGTSVPSLNDPLGVNEVGIPVSDPTADIAGEEPTILFQQFARVGYAGLPNTLEIRGRSPKLYIERVGGSMVDFLAAQGKAPQVAPGAKLDATPTIWESYDCSYDTTIGDPNFGTYLCNVTRPQVRTLSPKNHVPMYTDANQVDNNNGYCPNGQFAIAVEGAVGFGPVSWSGVPLKANLSDEPTIADITDVLTEGWVTISKRSSEDLPSVHEHMHCGVKGDLEKVGITAAGCVAIPFIGCALGFAAGNQAAGGACWSDWNVHIRPLALAAPDPNAGLLRVPPGVAAGPPFWNLLAANADPALDNSGVGMADMENEWEADWQNPWTNLADNHVPNPGNLIYLNGRWIMDCAHPAVDIDNPPFHSEIHPPNTFIVAEMAKAPSAMGGLFPNNPLDPNTPLVTRSQIWVNEFYEGHPFAITVWPPPRPSADAQLSAVYMTFGGGRAISNSDGSLSFPFVNDAVGGSPPAAQASAAKSAFMADGLSAAFSGPPGNHPVDGSGQDIFPRDNPDDSGGTVGSFMANWYVGWSQQ
jgi:hypothetical protein